jgi:ubiquinone/menaquinone biosynthesis C-methylase UbiE
MSQKKEIEKKYQERGMAKVFDDDRKKYPFDKYKHKLEANFLKKTITKFDKNKKIKILDVACGTGRMLSEVIRTNKNTEYNGLDSSEVMTSHLKEKAKKLKFPVNIKIGDATKLPYKDNTFDVTYTYHLTWHIPQNLQMKMISEMIRVTKKRGYVVFDVINENFIWDRYKWLFGKKPTKGIYKVNIKKIKQSLKRHKYEIDKLSDFPIKNSFWYSILNIANLSRKIFPKNMFHMIYFKVRK